MVLVVVGLIHVVLTGFEAPVVLNIHSRLTRRARKKRAAMVAQLRAARVEVAVDAEIYPNGRFARLHDPEGNPIELWEPK